MSPEIVSYDERMLKTIEVDVGLGHGLHDDGGLYPDLHPLLLQHVGPSTWL